MSEADEYGPGGAYESGQDQAYDDAVSVDCPECSTGWIPSREPRCPGCSLSWEDVEAGADFYLRLSAGEL